METKYSESIVLALLSADENGIIEIGYGVSASAIEDLTQSLMKLESQGFLSRVAGIAFYRPFQLTAKGRELKRMLGKAVTA